MTNTLNIQVDASKSEIKLGEGVQVPKCVTPLGDKLYFVDIGGKALHELDPATGVDRILEHPNIAAGQEKEFTTALGVNGDGSLMVATQSGIYYVKPDAKGGVPEWQLAAEFKGDLALGDNERVNNGVMVPCRSGPDGESSSTQFFIGTCAINPSDVKAGEKRPGRLMVLDNKLQLSVVKDDFMTVNALSGQDTPEGIVMTLADSGNGASLLKTAKYSPFAKDLGTTETTLVDFKNGQATAPNGRPDGTSPVIYQGKNCVAVAAIDSNEVRVYPVGEGEQKSDIPIAKFTLPADVKKPTMPTFATEDGKTVCYITAFDASSSTNIGKIYKLTEETNPELADFKPINNIGTYPSIEAVKSAAERVNSAAGSAMRAAKL